MHRVIRQRAGRDNYGRENRAVPQDRHSAPVRGYLPLVVTNKSSLQELTEILFQRKNLSKTPLNGKGLSRSFLSVVGPLPRPVNLPVAEEIRARPFVLGDVVGNPV